MQIEIRDERRSGPWFEEMVRLTSDPTSYVWLDAAQLVKHAFGLARTFHGRRTTLLYLFWEPTNASNFSVFDQHKREVRRVYRSRTRWLSRVQINELP